MKVGLISDTHGLVRPEALEALAGAERILHAGDVGGAHVVEALARVAPVTVIRGNVDRDSWGRSLPDTLEVELAGKRLWLLHDVKELDRDPAPAGIDVVVSGHSHKPIVERRDGVLFVNPGSAGPHRFRLPICIGWLHLGARATRARIVELAPSG